MKITQQQVTLALAIVSVAALLALLVVDVARA